MFWDRLFSVCFITVLLYSLYRLFEMEGHGLKHDGSGELDLDLIGSFVTESFKACDRLQ